METTTEPTDSCDNCTETFPVSELSPAGGEGTIFPECMVCETCAHGG